MNANPYDELLPHWEEYKLTRVMATKMVPPHDDYVGACRAWITRVRTVVPGATIRFEDPVGIDGRSCIVNEIMLFI